MSENNKRNIRSMGCLLAVVSIAVISLFMPLVIISLINHVVGFELMPKTIKSYMAISLTTIAVFLLWVLVDAKKNIKNKP
jgi:hypothetical protein